MRVVGWPVDDQCVEDEPLPGLNKSGGRSWLGVHQPLITARRMTRDLWTYLAQDLADCADAAHVTSLRNPLKELERERCRR